MKFDIDLIRNGLRNECYLNYESIRYGGPPQGAFDRFVYLLRSLLGTAAPFEDRGQRYGRYDRSNIRSFRELLYNVTTILSPEEVDSLHSSLTGASKALRDVYVIHCRNFYSLFGHRKEDLNISSDILDAIVQDIFLPLLPLTLTSTQK